MLDVYHYDSKDITVLIDDDYDTDHIQPTNENMVSYVNNLSLTHLMQLNSCVKIQKMVELVDDALPGDRFFFRCLYIIGRENDVSYHFLILFSPVMFKYVLKHLRKLLVDPLPMGCTLVANIRFLFFKVLISHG